MARYLLDTHVFICFVTQNLRLSREVDAIITAPSNEAFVSIASIWEISIKMGLDKMPALPGEPEDLMRAAGLIQLEVNVDHIRQVARLPFLHRDPFDRMLIAQAQIDGLTLITDDRRIARYDVATLRPG